MLYFSTHPVILFRWIYCCVMSFVVRRWCNISCILHHQTWSFGFARTTTIRQSVFHLPLLLHVRWCRAFKVVQTRIISTCIECVCVLRVASSFSLNNFPLLVHLNLSGLAQTFQLELHLLNLSFSSQYFLQTWTCGTVEIATGSAAYAIRILVRHTTVWNAVSRWIDSLCPVLRMLWLRQFTLRHLSQQLMLLTSLLDCRWLNIWTACMLL